MKRMPWMIGLILAVAAGAVVFWNTRRNAPSSKPAPYAQVLVIRGDVMATLEATASVRPETRVEVRPAIPGRMDEVLVREGDPVTRGQLLARMSSPDRAVMLDAARARGEDEQARWREIYRPTPLFAPLDGTVLERRAEPGQSVTPEQPALVVFDRLIIEALADETDLAQIQTGQTARITLDAYPNRPFSGVVTRIAGDARVVDNVTVYRVFIVPRSDPGFLRCGMTAAAVFEIDRRTNVCVLPVEAVHETGGRSSVRVPASDPAAPPVRVAVETGLSDGRRVEIVSGVKEGDPVCVPVIRAPLAEGTAGKSPFVPQMTPASAPAKP